MRLKWLKQLQILISIVKYMYVKTISGVFELYKNRRGIQYLINIWGQMCNL